MKPVEHIKRLLTKLNVDPSPEMHERTLTDMIAAHVRRVEKSRPSGLPALWALLARYGTAGAGIAAIVLGILVAVLAIRDSATPAYAVEQTVEAIKRIPVVHIFGRDWDDRRIEMWVKVNSETGLMDSCQINHPDEDRFLVSTPRNTYDYDGKTNTVRIKDGPSVASIFCLGDFFGGIEDLAKQLDGKVTYCGVTDPGTKRSLLELKMSAPNLEIVCLIDSRTKLPISIDVTRGVRFNRYDILRNATLIRYDEAPPEGLFDFTIPAGANITIETSQDPLQSLPASVLRRCGEFHLRTIQETAKPLGIRVNTRLFFVNGDFALHIGGFMGIRNDSNEVWKGEVGVGNVDPPNMAIFDAATGKKQQIRLVQHRQSPPGRFRVYWQLDEPLAPGQTRYGIYWQNEAAAMQERPADHAYPLVMNNRFGSEAIENFLLIVPAGISVHDASTEYQSREEIEGYSIYIWQRHLPKQMIVSEVQVLLSPAGDGR
jgi:hypothetical protein